MGGLWYTTLRVETLDRISFGIPIYFQLRNDELGEWKKRKRHPSLRLPRLKPSPSSSAASPPPRRRATEQAGSPHPRMVDAWWPLLAAAIPAVVAGQAFRVKRRRDEEQRLKAARGREKSSDEVFVCERVCTSKRMLKKVGAFSKDPIPETCVTVCGVSELDACADACARTVCVNQHQVPNWNDVCLKRCQSECLKLSSTLIRNASCFSYFAVYELQKLVFCSS
uniref:Uncharacterized protein n=2 Tax=Oryza meridionalis TaxID=40149 RepID=A0A0E0CWC9_9ORYZ